MWRCSAVGLHDQRQAFPAGARSTVNGRGVTDDSFADDVVMPADGSVNRPAADTVAAGEYRRDLPDHSVGNTGIQCFSRLYQEFLGKLK